MCAPHCTKSEAVSVLLQHPDMTKKCCIQLQRGWSKVSYHKLRKISACYVRGAMDTGAISRANFEILNIQHPKSQIVTTSAGSSFLRSSSTMWSHLQTFVRHNAIVVSWLSLSHQPQLSID